MFPFDDIIMLFDIIVYVPTSILRIYNDYSYFDAPQQYSGFVNNAWPYRCNIMISKSSHQQSVSTLESGFHVNEIYSQIL